MTGSLLLATLLVLGAPVGSAAPSPPMADTLSAIYETGRTFSDFVSQATRRVELWERLGREGTVDPELVARAKAVGGTWSILAISEDWCGDSAYNLPYVAKLVEEVDGLELRIVNAKAGRSVMEAYRTPDHRPATPTLLLLDAAGTEVGCFVERPAPLMAWYMENLSSKTTDELHAYILDFYGTDGGRSTASEIVEMLEAAAAGGRRCTVGTP